MGAEIKNEKHTLDFCLRYFPNFKNYKNIIFFMGNRGRKILNDTLKEWDIDFEEKKSLTNEDSFILNIKKIRKKIS